MIRVETDLPCRTDSTICIAFLGLLGDLFALIYIKTLYLKTGKKQWDVFTRYYIFGFYGLFLGYIWKLLVLLVNHYFTNGSYYRILRKVPKSGAGVDMGRNIFQSENPAAMLQAVRAVVHEKATAAEGYDLFLSLL